MLDNLVDYMCISSPGSVVFGIFVDFFLQQGDSLMGIIEDITVSILKPSPIIACMVTVVNSEIETLKLLSSCRKLPKNQGI